MSGAQHRANQFGRIAALVLFGIFGLTLIFSSLADRLSRPLVRLGNRLSQNSDAGPSASAKLVANAVDRNAAFRVFTAFLRGESFNG